jgi:protocatechuate 3,4-dioxygenase beta subunit
MKQLSRRNYLKNAVLSTGALLLAKNAVAGSCELTPPQTEGPFYPIADQWDKDNDLTSVQGSNKKALGEVIVLKGVVSSADCKPLSGVMVEIWQACETGKYNHPGDPNTAKLDRNFQYWGRAVTNEKGEYQFKTIRPGHYQATPTWIRPAHIHLKVHRRGYEELTTQVYFADDPHNSKDRILQSLSPAERAQVIVDFNQSVTTSVGRVKAGTFDITIRGYQ